MLAIDFADRRLYTGFARRAKLNLPVQVNSLCP